jgi:phage terminase large subunit
MKLSVKQTLALDYLEDKETEVLLYGGAVAGGKSVLLCYWQMKQCLKYAGVRYLLGRKTRKTLYETTVRSFFEVAKLQGLKLGEHFDINNQTDIITFYNGSEIFLKNLETKPSDPNYDEFGSLELTGAGIDECPQIEERLYEIIRSRIRYKLDLVGGVPKLAMTANPTKNWVKRAIHDKCISGEFGNNVRFVRALPYDNPYVSKAYLKSLEQLNEIDKQRLLYGNWEYADDETQLINTLQINNFLNGSKSIGGKRYITADIALMGSDMFVITVWEGWHIIEIVMIPKSNGQQVINELIFLSTLHHVEVKNICYDADGVGGFIGGFLQDAIPFNNGSSPILTEDDIKKNEELKKMGASYSRTYPNLKTQCIYETAEKITKGICTMESGIIDGRYRDRLASELSYWRRARVDDDTKLYIIKKEVVKKALQTSPDISDSIMMRALFDLLDNENESPYLKLLTK